MDRFGARSLDQVLASIALPGTDPAAVSEYVLGRMAARRRRSRALVAAAAVLVLLVGGTAFALTGGEDPSEVVAPAADEADGDDARDRELGDAADGSGSVVTAVPTTTTTTLTTSTSFPSIAGQSSLPGFPRSRGSGSSGGFGPPAPPAGTAPSPPTATTAPADAPLSLDKLVVNAAPVGAIVEVSAQWSDPDLPAGTVASARVVATGEGAFASAPLQLAGGACTGGTGASGTVSGALRFSRAGRHTITVEVSTCAGEPRTLSTEVDIAAAASGTPLKVRVPGGVAEAGTWTYTPSEGENAGTPIPVRGEQDNDPRFVQYLDSEPATVLMVPAVAGTISQSVGGCTRSAAVGDPTTEVATLAAC